MNIYLGIDPGASGALAIISEVIKVFDYEDSDALFWLKVIGEERLKGDIDVHAVIEKVNAMPKQGVSSMFKFGRNYGQWIGRLETLGIPFDYVTPQKWKKAMFDSMPKDDPKNMALDRARRLFPQMQDRLKRKKDHNRAEALLICAYCKKIYS
jgi:hypothetical protein